MSRDVLIVPTGVANLASVQAGLRRAGARPRLAEDATEVAAASHVVLPGVGAFAPAMKVLRERGYDRVLRERVAEGRPTLAICLGLQVLFEESEENPGARGLALVEGGARRFPDTVRVPQLGWNRVEANGCRILESGHAYFANSYRLDQVPSGWSAAWADHGGRFLAAMERGGVLACQFHPELSGAWGVDLLRRWLEG